MLQGSKETTDDIRVKLERIVENALERLKSVPDDADATLELAKAARMLGLRREAERAARRLIELRPSATGAYRLLHEILQAGPLPGPYLDYVIWLARERPNIGVQKSTKFGIRQAAAIERGMPSIQMATADRCASKTLRNGVQQLLGVPNIYVDFEKVPGIMKTDGGPRIVPEVYEVFARGGAITKEHMRPLPENIEVMRRFGCTRIVVHFRDPRQQLVSRERANEARNIGGYYGRYEPHRSLTERIDAQLDEHFTFWMRWLQTWVDLSQENGGPLDVLFTTYEEFMTDKPALVEKIIGFYGIPSEAYSLDNLDLNRATRHYRQGAQEEWRGVMTPEQQERSWALMPAPLCQRFGWKR